jgi:glycosyltransferase involved in cell wall biosynthesis
MPKIKILIDTNCMDGRLSKGTATVCKNHLENMLDYSDAFDITLIHKNYDENILYKKYKNIVIKKYWPYRFGGVINEFLFFIMFWIKIFLKLEKRFDIYFVCYSRILPTFFMAPAKHKMYFPMDGGPDSAGYVLEKVKTPFPFYVRLFKKNIDRFLVLSKFGQDGVAHILNIKNSKNNQNIIDKKIPIIGCGLEQDFLDGKIYDDILENRKYLKDKYSYPENYILCVSRFDPHKNILGIVEAYYKYKNNSIKNNISRDYLPLVFVGGRHMPDYSKRVEQKIIDLNLQKDIIISPYIQTSDLYRVYKNAELFLFLSFYEGFGIPVLEAAAAGTPMIVSNMHALNEVAGDGAYKVNPYVTDQISQAMIKVLSDKDTQNDLIEKAKINLEKYDWKNETAKLAKVFQDLA